MHALYHKYMQKLVQCIFQCFARAEFWNFCCLDLDFCTCARISAFAGSAFANSECAKANQGNCTAFFQGCFDCAKSCVKCTSCGSFGDVSTLGNMLD